MSPEASSRTEIATPIGAASAASIFARFMAQRAVVRWSIDLSSQPVTETKACLIRWAKTIRDELAPLGMYVFGSLIYREGSQFGDRSDIDLIIVMPEMPDAIDRANWLERLVRSKVLLEDELGKLLRRPSRDALICSVVAVTSREVSADIHKDGAVNFFSENAFLDLLSGELVGGLPTAGSREIRERLVGECVRFAQRTRNSYLGVNSLGVETLKPFNDHSDPAPKQIMRHAAMVQYLKHYGEGHRGEEYDVEIGATYLTVLLRQRRKRVDELSRRFEARRSGRLGCALSSCGSLPHFAWPISGIPAVRPGGPRSFFWDPGFA
jgi:predicted nucleotidyltransferase